MNREDAPVIIGAGLAGLRAALGLAALRPVVLSAAPLGHEAASGWAQGGLAAAIGGDDGVSLHLADTLAAGDGMCDPATAARITEAGPAVVRELAALGAEFDRNAEQFALGLEAGHSRRRIVHAAGDGSGREILRALIAAVRADARITVIEARAVRLLRREGAIAGVLARNAGGPLLIPASRVVVATGGAGGLYRHTTNPVSATGSGLMLAARAGAALADLEFVQFHPTALDVGLDPMPLVSEAVRGEGAVLIDAAGERFMAGQGRAELEPRDVVARAVWQALQRGPVWLDARHLGAGFHARFPGISRACAAAGIDPARQPIPVRPAAHYFMGGIAVDARGRSTVPGLWACGEAARTGLHGANRLASNSLLEAAVTGAEVARDVAATAASRPAPLTGMELPAARPADGVRSTLSRHAGVLREAAGLRVAVIGLAGEAAASDAAALGMMMTVAMLRREESRGAHARTDFPGRSATVFPRLLTLAEATRMAAALRRGEENGQRRHARV